jgi:hypothetical protein
MELPLSSLIFLLSKKVDAIFKYEPGMDVNQASCTEDCN